MVRAVVFASIALGSAACRPAQPAAPLGHGSSSSGTPQPASPARGPRSPRGPREALAAQHHAEVTIEQALSMPGGEVVVYGYSRLESKLGERTAAGHDVTAELAVERRRCDAERAALPPEEREWIETQEQSCEEIAASVLFGDDQLTPGCQDTGVASFDPQGRLVGHVVLDGPCLIAIDSFEAYDLTPEAADELMLVATFGRFGQTRGGWSTEQESTRLHVLATRAADGEATLAAQLVVELNIAYEGGACQSGIHRSLRVADDGALEVFSQPWDECARADCIEPDDEAAEEADPSQICQDEPVTAERVRWRSEERSWGAFEPMAHEGNVLPDGIMK
jgi:hypothetical protein